MTDIKERLAAAYEWMREPDYAEHFSVTDLLKWANRRDVGAHRDALAEIERLEAENKRLDEMAARAVECFNNVSEAALQVFAEREALRTRNERMGAALREAHLCFEAAVTEGLHDAIAESADERLLDLLRRRVLWAHGVLGAALSTQPVETDEERDARRASVLNTVIQPYTRWHPMFAARMARAIAESDKARKS